ncbi:hypothetical protein CVT25_015312 [Psilocybe cyanescens]|uniref:DUF6534 domain-containing protein n=1 Tax=Psilocybe cyanescens TaxID=93625 RepID=A0A409WH06_PSICY|nr:hypothetical protein CVT25_015312 [Psilocybe cyanescens]
MSDSVNATVPAGLPIPIPPGISKIPSTAPLMFGILVSWMLYGMLVVQVLYGVFLLDTLQTCMMGADAFYWFCSGFGDMGHLGNVYISAFDTPMLGGLMALLVQSFFCYRIWMLSQAIIIPVTLWLGHLHGNLAAAQAQINTRVLEVWLIGSVIADTLIACCLVYLLMKNRSIHTRTNYVLQRLTRITMETNSLSASLAILTVILYFGAPGTSYFLTPTYYFGKIYANSLLVTLNNRFFLASGVLAGSNMGSKPSSRSNGNSSGRSPYTEVSTFSATLENSNSAAAITSFKVPALGDSGELSTNYGDPPKHGVWNISKEVEVA